MLFLQVGRFRLGALLLFLFPAGTVYAQLPPVVMSPWGVALDGQTVITWSRHKRLSGGSHASSQLQSSHIFNFRGASEGFVWKPWFSRLSLGVRSGFAYNTFAVRGTEGRSKSSGWNNTSGFTLGLGLLPGSRMPFDLSFSVDKHIDSTQGSAGYAALLRLSQQYSPLQRRSLRLKGVYEYADSADRAEQRFNFNVDDVLGLHRLDLRYEWMHSVFAENENKSESTSQVLSAGHAYRHEGNAFSTNNFFNYIDSGVGGSSAEVLQLVNSSRWSPPRYGGKIDYSATTRWLQSTTESGGLARESQQLGHNSRLGYDVTRELTLSASLDFLQIGSGDSGDSVTTAEGLGVNYSAPSIDLSGWQYRWNAGSSVQASQNDVRNNLDWTAQGQHLIDKRIDYGSEERARVSLAQSLAADVYRKRVDPHYRLSHTANYFRSRPDEDAISSVNLTASDDRQIAGTEELRQLLTMSFEHDRTLQNGAGLNSDLGLQLFRNLDDAGQESIGYSVDGSLGYRLSPLFRIARLVYEAKLSVDASKALKTAEGELGEMVVNALLSNQLRWSWGLLSLSGVFDVTASREASDARLRFEIRRRWRPLN